LVFPWRVGTKKRNGIGTNGGPNRTPSIFEQSGEIAAVDFRQFGKRAGEIIADATRLPHRKPH